MADLKSELLELRLIYHPRFFSWEHGTVVHAMEEFALSSERASVYLSLASDPDTLAQAGALAETLAAGWPESLRKRIRGMLALPYVKAKAHALRSELEADEALACDVAACVRIWDALGQCALNGTQIRAVLRDRWTSKGLAAHPLVRQTPCPQCERIADVELRCRTLSPGSLQLGSGRLTCASCGLVETYPGGASPFASEADTSLADIRTMLKTNPATSSPGRFGQLARQRLLEQLQHHVPRFVEDLRAEVVAREQKLHHHLRTQRSVWHFRLYTQTTTVPPHLLEAPEAVPVAGADRYQVRESRWDTAINTLETHLLRLKPAAAAEGGDLFGHWRTEFQELMLLVENALIAQDAVETTVRLVHLMKRIEHWGVLTDWLLCVPLDMVPDGPWQQAPRQRATTARVRLPETDIGTLSAFLAQGLRQEPLPSSPDTLRRLLESFAQGRPAAG